MRCPSGLFPFSFLFFWLSSAAWAECPTDVQIVSELTCSSTITGTISATAANTMGGECADMECYTCGDPNDEEKQIAPEHVYSFECQQSGTVRLLITDLPCDLDIYALDSSCDPYSGCLQGSTAPFAVDDEVVFECTAGETHYIVIEAYGVEHLNQASGPCTDDGTSSGTVFDPSYTLSFDVSASTGALKTATMVWTMISMETLDCSDSDCGLDPVCCDLDGDGFFSEECGGEDCDDNDADINPIATDVPDNGVDEDCTGADSETQTAAMEWKTRVRMERARMTSGLGGCSVAPGSHPAALWSAGLSRFCRLDAAQAIVRADGVGLRSRRRKDSQLTGVASASNRDVVYAICVEVADPVDVPAERFVWIGQEILAVCWPTAAASAMKTSLRAAPVGCPTSHPNRRLLHRVHTRHRPCARFRFVSLECPQEGPRSRHC